MTGNSPASQFFIAGGTLPLGAAYVVRPTDEQLLRTTLSGEYCNVLTPRQIGKSSLMVRTAARLRDEGVRTAVIDLTDIGTELIADEWYLGLVTRLKRQLELAVDERAWWEAHAQQGVVQRFSDFLRDVLLEEIATPVVIFVDEIDSTLSLPFTDDFFAAIRAAYNARASDPVYKRLTFVLLGVVRPADLIKDRSRTPYNIGTSIDLKDFSLEEARPLLPGLEAVSPEQAEEILQWVFHWTGGHPYLTQKVCAEIVASDDGQWTNERIDRLVRQLFMSDEARKESNLQYVSDRIRESRDREKLLRLYRKVLSGKPVADEERDPVKSQLKLAGLLKVTKQGALAVRNRIYKEVFNLQWIKDTMPKITSRRIAIVTTVIAVISMALVGWLLYTQQNSEEILAQTYTETFLDTQSAAVRITNLAGLFQLGGEFVASGRDLFFGLDANQQLAMFTGLNAPEQVGNDLEIVIRSIYTHLENTREHNELLRAMADDLNQIKDTHPDSRIVCGEIQAWLQGREHFQSGNYQDAIGAYTQAINYNGQNPGTHFERALALVAADDYEGALADLEKVLNLREEWQDRVRQAVVNDNQLYQAFQNKWEAYPKLATLIPTEQPTDLPPEVITASPTEEPTLEPKPTVGETRIRIRAIDGMTMVYVPGGTFQMGSEESVPDADADEFPQHAVTLDDFWIDWTEVSGAQFRRFVAETGYETDAEQEGWGRVWTGTEWERVDGADWQRLQGSVSQNQDDHPVVQVSWNDAVAYCEWTGARLPTEAEWEYTARGERGYIYPWGNEFNCLYGNFGDETELDTDIVPGGERCDGYVTTAPAGSFPAGVTWCGAQDMSGNVWEWVYDWYGDYPFGAQTNPTGPTGGDFKVLRSGSWNENRADVRTANRNIGYPSGRDSNVGFRCVVPLGE